VFDMDGLLLDTEVLYREAMTAAAMSRGLDVPSAVFLRMIGLQGPDSDQVLRDHFGEAFDAAAFRADTFRCFHDLAEAEVRLKGGVVELLDRMDELGLPRAIATSSGRASVERHLSQHGLLRRFDAVVANGDYARGKPHPEPYLLAAERLGVEPAGCLALEDSHNGVRSAAAAGMMTVMVPDLLDPTAEMRDLCVRIARDLHEVRDLLRTAG
jgi:HAD superfamily hydrolase (TIGR01509 family)